MIQNHFVADNSRFGVVLSRVMAEHGISTRQFTALCGVKTQRVCDLKRQRRLSPERVCEGGFHAALLHLR